MIKKLFSVFNLVISLSAFGQTVHPLNNEAFLQNEVASVYVTIQPTYLDLILGDSLYSDYNFPADFKYISSIYQDSVFNIGFRLRGNTSRDAGKKSFKIGFNDFVAGQKFKGLEKMNLNGNHNDPSQLRSRLSNQLLAKDSLTAARTSFVRLYINNEYKGLYLNVEHFDDEFLQKRFINNDQGNLYKCLYGADLMNWGPNQSNYQWTYELQTNKVANDYSGLIQFINVLNSSSDTDFPCAIQAVFDVDNYLKTFVHEILIAHWDGYAVNKNNYYLYQRPSDGKFMFLEYDMDNTFGIDWFGVDWTNRNINTWASSGRPLNQRIFAVPYFKDRFNYYMQKALAEVYLEADIMADLQQTQSIILAAGLEDTYKELDYGFTDNDFQNALTIAFGQHVTFSLQEYIHNRILSANTQALPVQQLENPCQNSGVSELATEDFVPVRAVDLLGREIDLTIKNQLIILVDKQGRTKKQVAIYE
jgi:hypothetical protein